MQKYSKLLLVVAIGVLATPAAADPSIDPSTCTTCDPSHREQIKADRAKYDLENGKAQEELNRQQIKAARAKYDRDNEKVIDRPWDTVKGGVPSPAD
jgi:hypothetical protein